MKEKSFNSNSQDSVSSQMGTKRDMLVLELCSNLCMTALLPNLLLVTTGKQEFSRQLEI